MNDYIQIADKRPNLKEIERWHNLAYRTSMAMIMLFIAILLINTLILNRLSLKLVSIIMWWNSIKIIRNINHYITIMVRLGFIKKYLNTTLMIINPLNMFKNIKKIMEKEIKRLEIIRIDERIKQFNKPRKELDKKYLKFNNEISDYWIDLGLTDLALKDQVCCRLEANTPVKPDNEERICFNAIVLLPSGYWLSKLACQWVPALMSDQAHVKSLIKRVCGKKLEPDIRITKKFEEKMVSIYEQIGLTEPNLTKNIIKAMQTKGTAGQYAKKSAFEEIWKQSTSKEMIRFWKTEVIKYMKTAMITKQIEERLISYMLYRKREALPLNEEGVVKITRIMNAPSLPSRYVDSHVFEPVGEGMSMKRGIITPNIGINIFIELKMILIYNPNKKMLELDISDYDGGITAAQGYVNCKARMLHMIKNNYSIEEICYLIPRYDKHIFRIVRSTKGITYMVLGSQATGDITTSVDNTSKSAAAAEMIIDTLEEEKIITNSWPQTHGDDNITSFSLHGSKDDIEHIVKAIMTDLGWQIKEGSVIINDALQDGKAMFLSHGVKIKKILCEEDKELQFAILVREKVRLCAKWAIAAEMGEKINKETRAKLASKYLSFLMTSLGHPDVMMASIHMLLYLQSTSGSYTGQYTWGAIEAKTMADVTLENIVKLQLPITLKYKPIAIEVTDEEKSNIIETIILINNLLRSNHKQFGYTGNVVQFHTNIVTNYWYYEATLNELIIVLKQYEKSSHIFRPTGTVCWWDIVERTVKPKPVRIGKIRFCEHVLEIAKWNESRWEVKILCEECWSQRIEEPYKEINCTINDKIIREDY